MVAAKSGSGRIEQWLPHWWQQPQQEPQQQPQPQYGGRVKTTVAIVESIYPYIGGGVGIV